ncbi:hypothetical protein PROFUN_07286 [Planoprotostelium fungivorum]|uniref:F-box domain-containing protein n=1 Tax=Planoprotostelium fungivorum TaxID=1890364 RepID=A0A2P6NM59_9EUKA|nr:hypothetical protein PROFUN_07286 [Planoprotostelium fungivorum]
MSLTPHRVVTLARERSICSQEDLDRADRPLRKTQKKFVFNLPLHNNFHTIRMSHVINDPCNILPPEMFDIVLGYLDESDIRTCSMVNSSWRSAAESIHIWQEQCDRLWIDKVYVPQKYLDMKWTDPKEAYFQSIKDSKRDVITQEELLGFDWQFRFKESPGAWYSESDPWFHGRAPSTHKYQDGGAIKISGEYSGFAPEQRRWRWMDDISGDDRGGWIQICHYPAYKVFRTNNWGWMQQSELALLVSFPLPPRGACKELEDEALPEVPDRLWARLPRGRSHRSSTVSHSLIRFLLSIGNFSELEVVMDDATQADDLSGNLRFQRVQSIELHASRYWMKCNTNRRATWNCNMSDHLSSDLSVDFKEKRRAQNRVAQRRYREKQKQKLQDLQSLATSSPTNIDAILDPILEQLGLPVGDHKLIPSVDFSELPSDGISSDSHTDPPSMQLVPAHSNQVYTFPDEKHLVLSGYLMIRALIDNALLLSSIIPNFDPRICIDELESPFCSSDVQSIKEHQCIAPTHLRPTNLQLITPHHPWIDCFPWPGFRDRFIAALDFLDENDLCHRLHSEEEGIMVWGNTPADEFSYEMTESFATKFWFLVDKDMLRATNWWRRQRGLLPESVLFFHLVRDRGSYRKGLGDGLRIAKYPPDKPIQYRPSMRQLSALLFCLLSAAVAHQTLSFSMIKRRTTLKRSITDTTRYATGAWLLNITVGSPPKSYALIFDTGSVQMALHGVCIGGKRYNASESTTSRIPLIDGQPIFDGTKYLDKSGYNGTLVEDVISFGGISIRANFTQIRYSSLKFAQHPDEGIIGAGVSQDGQVSPLQTLALAHQMKNRFFVFYGLNGARMIDLVHSHHRNGHHAFGPIKMGAANISDYSVNVVQASFNGQTFNFDKPMLLDSGADGQFWPT